MADGPADRIAELARTPEGRLSVVGALIAPLPVRALNNGDVWTIAVYETIYALANVVDGDPGGVLEKWQALTFDAPMDYLHRVVLAVEEA